MVNDRHHLLRQQTELVDDDVTHILECILHFAKVAKSRYPTLVFSGNIENRMDG